MKRFWKNNSLSVTIFGIFAVAIVAMSVTGWYAENNDLSDHQQPAISYGEYISSGTFIEGVFENWESEFLQMWALVMLTIFLRQKGAGDSKPIRGTTPQDTRARYKHSRATTIAEHLRATKHFIYAHSLGLALLALFLVSFCLHAAGGATAYNETALQHGQSTVTTVQYVGTSQFWYESFQNWQSEFLAVGTLLVLSIKLRERGSPESKPVGLRYDGMTGE